MRTSISALEGVYALPGTERWRSLSLLRRFAILALLLSVAGTLVLGAWVSNRIEKSALAHEASSAAVYIGQFISPLLGELEEGDTLSNETLTALDQAMDSAEARLRVVAVKVWSPEGRILYSNDRSKIGRLYEIGPSLASALSGTVAAEFNDEDNESDLEFRRNRALVEVYAPVRSRVTRQVMAAVEFYDKADDLQASLTAANRQSWFVTGLVLMLIVTIFSALVRDGSRTIDSQRRELTLRIAELSDLMKKKEALQDRVERGARNVIEENERFLKGIGSDLHDGPAQLMALALLRMDGIGRAVPGNGDLAATRTAVKDALFEIRAISAGLVLPDMYSNDLAECIEATVRSHETMTGTEVNLSASSLPAQCPTFVKICVCRFIQEGLSNAFWHAGGAGQSVVVSASPTGLSATVSDTGPGIGARAAHGERLGLRGLRGRLESIRGTLRIEGAAGQGTTLVAWIPLEG